LAVRQVEVTAVVSVTFPANLPANNKVYATIQLDPAIAALSQLNIPATEAWVIEDIFVAASQTPDTILEFVRNLTESKLRSPPINGMLVTNVARPVPKPIVYKGNDIMTVIGQNLAAIGTAAATVTAYAKLRRFIG